MNKKSAENDELALARSISGRQQTLSQVIAKDAVLLTNHVLSDKQSQILKDSLVIVLSTFQHQQELLQHQIEQTKFPVPQSVFQIRLLFSSIKPYYKDILAIGQEIVQADSTLLQINSKLYCDAMLDNEQKFLAAMKEITNQYSIILNEKSRRSRYRNW